MSEQDNKQENIEEQIGIDAEIHLGDEVYASYNGPLQQITLRKGDHRIAFKPGVLAELLGFLSDCDLVFTETP
jgi:hypothetical protein